MAKSVLSLKRSAIAALALAMTFSPLSVHAQQPAQQPAPGGATNGQAQDMLPAPPASAPTVDTQSSSAPQAPSGPAPVSDLADGLLDAVVNISTSQNVDRKDAGPTPPQMPDGTPLAEFLPTILLGDGTRGNKQANSSD